MASKTKESPTQEDKSKAEDLRLQGNDAYKTEDFERALELYKQSAEYFPQANTLSNTVAVLHKLGRYEEAKEAAQRATEIDPKWAKGWWRRGVAAELLKDFHWAHTYYSEAVKLDKKNAVFRQHVNDIKNRLKLVEDGKSPMPVQEMIEQPMTAMDLPTMKAFTRVQAWMEEVGPHGTLYDMEQRYGTANTLYQMKGPTSEQYLFHGICRWLTGMKCAIADLASSLSHQTLQYAQITRLKVNSGIITLQEINHAERLLGGLPAGNATDSLISAYAHLGGRNVFIETAPGRICPAPASLQRFLAYQILAQLGCVQKCIMALQQTDNDFGSDMKCAPGVVQAHVTFYHNLQAPPPIDISEKSQNCTPEEIQAYVREQVKAGRSWSEGGLRSYVSAMFRGSILFATVIRSMGQQIAAAYNHLKWSREFITLLDEEYKVTENGSYGTYGTSFKPSLRVGMIMAELDLLTGLRGDAVNGPYPISLAIDLCMELSRLANIVEDDPTPSDYQDVLQDVTWRRKPMAMAHSNIAALLNDLRCRTACHEDFVLVVTHHGLIGEEEGEACDPFALIAIHYRIAAENELPDAEEGSILWWAHAANLAQAKSQRTLGELRHAISRAEACDEARDTALFGENMQKNGEYESIAKLTARHFEDQPDEFVFPRVILNTKQSTVELVDGTVICDDFTQYQENNLRLAWQQKESERMKEVMDTSALEKKFGLVVKKGPPSLATLSVRELHKSGASFAKGETDGDVIVQKAMDAAGKENADVEVAPVPKSTV
ncbi:Heat shock protein (Sti1) [Seminavis robusta]|uniref:Heat shock protein (Sti1) n=1 Tax=Seminavis robusta TaxID=568900 RepID=A0A9N8EJ78_9STRA|nr:Heat shock protein (Sti1) [Seminavis robusta]|eukprot:Sro1328_g263220.1 Heat shock protein (Sti1) (774) ;mRNA; f:21351-23672